MSIAKGRIKEIKKTASHSTLPERAIEKKHLLIFMIISNLYCLHDIINKINNKIVKKK